MLTVSGFWKFAGLTLIGVLLGLSINVSSQATAHQQGSASNAGSVSISTEMDTLPNKAFPCILLGFAVDLTRK